MPMYSTGGLGKVRVFTGAGQGKSIAALGFAVRVSIAGQKVAIIYFDKGLHDYSERDFLDLYNDHIEYYLTGLNRRDIDTGLFRDEVLPEEIILAGKGMEKAQEMADSGQYDVLLLDEINMMMAHGLVPVAELLNFIARKPASLELVLTGNYCPDSVIYKADIVTQMNNIKP